MTEDTSGILWWIIDVVAVLVLAAAIFYAISLRRKRLSAGTKAARDEAVRDLYDKPKDKT